MDTYERTCEWFRMLGYDGDFPEYLDKIQNNATSFIWDQLIQNSKSRIEVENMRDQILISRLSEYGLNKQDFQYPLKEINLYKRRKELEKELQCLNYSITEKQKTNSHLVQQNKINYFSIERINLKKKEMEEREFLLREKMKILDKDIQVAEDILNGPMNDFLNDQGDISNSKDITKMMNQCEEKLQRDVKQLPIPLKNTLNENISRLTHSTQKSTRKNNVFERYLCLTEKQTSKKIKKHMANKENIGTNKVKVCLFSQDETMMNSILTEDNSPHRKDSIELNFDSNDDENFLVDLKKASFLATPSNYKFDLNSPNPTKNKPEGSFSYNKISNTSSHQESNQVLVKKMLNESASNDIKDLLNHYNCQSIWTAFQIHDDNLHFGLSKMVNFRNNEFPSLKSHKTDDLARLQSLHVSTEFKIIRNNLTLKQLTERVNKKKESLNLILMNSGYNDDLIDSLQKNLELHTEDVALDSTIEVMKREINNIQNSAKISDSSEIKKTLLEIKDGIASKKNSVSHYLDLIKEIFISIKFNRNITSSFVRKLAPYSTDLAWCSLLVEKVNAREITLFEEFPLEYNRKCIYTDKHSYYRDMHTDRFLSNREIDDNLHVLCNILDTPFTAPETVILDILRAKCKLEALKSIKCAENNNTYEKYTLKTLKSKESYISHILDQFNSLMASSASAKTLSVSSMTKKIMNMWIEMPYKDYISPKRTYEDHDYKYYEKVFDSYYNNL